MMIWLKKVNAIQTANTNDLVKKLTIRQKLMKLERKLRIMTSLIILLYKNLIS